MQQLTSPQALSWKVRLGILLPLLAMASMPLFVYFQFEHEHILLWMWLILIAVQMVLSLRTARLAIGMMSSIRKRDGKHIQLTLTEAEAKTFPRDVFKAVMRATWIDHVMLALPRLGVSLAFMQYFHASPLWWMSQSNIIFNARPFFYITYNYNMGEPTVPTAYADITQVFIAFFILLLYSVGEGIFSVTLSIFFNTFVRIHQAIKCIRMIRLIFGISTIGIFLLLGQLIVQHEQDKAMPVWRVRMENYFCQSSNEVGRQNIQTEERINYCKEIENEVTLFQTIESTQVTMISFFDQGILLSSNIMRINRSFWDNEWYESSHPYPPTMIRNILSALLAFAIYGVIIWSSLQIARNRLVKFGTCRS